MFFYFFFFLMFTFFYFFFFFFSSRRRHTRLQGDWSSDVCSSDLANTSPASWGTSRRTFGGRSGARTRRGSTTSPSVVFRVGGRAGGAGGGAADHGRLGLPLDRQDFPTWAVFGVATHSWNGSVCPFPRPSRSPAYPPARLFRNLPASSIRTNQTPQRRRKVLAGVDSLGLREAAGWAGGGG